MRGEVEEMQGLALRASSTRTAPSGGTNRPRWSTRSRAPGAVSAAASIVADAASAIASKA